MEFMRIPTNLTKFPFRHDMNNEHSFLFLHLQYPHYIDGLKYAALYIAYSNSSINPLLYGGLNEHFRRSFIHICHCTRLRNRNRVAPGKIIDFRKPIR